MSWDVLVSLFFLKNSFTKYRAVVWQVFFFLSAFYLISSLLVSMIPDEKLLFLLRTSSKLLFISLIQLARLPICPSAVWLCHCGLFVRSPLVYSIWWAFWRYRFLSIIKCRKSLLIISSVILPCSEPLPSTFKNPIILVFLHLNNAHKSLKIGFLFSFSKLHNFKLRQDRRNKSWAERKLTFCKH